MTTPSIFVKLYSIKKSIFFINLKKTKKESFASHLIDIISYINKGTSCNYQSRYIQEVCSVKNLFG